MPLQHPSRMVECLDDAVLGRGLAGVEISSFAGDVELSDDRLEPFWARAAELGAVVFLHPFGCSLDERLDRFYLSNTVGQPAENAVALSHLIFAGVLDRHPDLKIVAAHGGGYLPFAIGRSDRAWRVRPEAQRCEHAPRRTCGSSGSTPSCTTRARCGTSSRSPARSRVLLGSDFPFDMGLDDPVTPSARRGLPDEITAAHPRRERRRAARDAGAGMRIARCTGGSPGTGKGRLIRYPSLRQVQALWQRSAGLARERRDGAHQRLAQPDDEPRSPRRGGASRRTPSSGS